MKKKIIAFIKSQNSELILFGGCIVATGIVIDMLTPWIDTLELFKFGNCITDMHFENYTKVTREEAVEQFIECASPDIKKIQVIQWSIIYTNTAYVIGGILIGFGFGKRVQRKNDA